MSIILPRFVVIKSNLSGKYLRYITEPEAELGFVSSTEPSVFNTFCKIEVERAKIDGRFVHLRFSNSNKYWARKVGPSLHATSNQPEEDRSKLSCTLFEPFERVDGSFSFTHVQSGWILASPQVGGQGNNHVFLDRRLIYTINAQTSFTVVDWETLVMIPRHVTFKGDNGMYLKAAWIERHEYLQFSSNDSNEKATGYEVTMNPDGHIRVKSNFFDKFWRRSPNWIWADSSDTSSSNKDTLFLPVHVTGNTIALRNAGNNRFCKRLTTEGKTSCLNAAEPTITKEARLELEELVLDRQIFDVKFRMDDARIYDETTIIAGRGTSENRTDIAASMSITVEYQEHSSYSFTNSVSIMLGVTSTIKTGLPFIFEGKIEISAEVTNSFEWNRTTSNTKSAQAMYTATVPPHSRIIVEYVATVGKCDVPFSYTQRDRLSSDGRVVTTQRDDGVYTGVNYYSFHFNQPQINSL